MSTICYANGVLAADTGGARDLVLSQQRVSMCKIITGDAKEADGKRVHPAFAIAMCGDKLLRRQAETLIMDIGTGLYLHYLNDHQMPLMIQSPRMADYLRCHLIVMTADQVFEYNRDFRRKDDDPMVFVEFDVGDVIVGGLGGTQALVCLHHGMTTAQAVFKTALFRGDEPNPLVNAVEMRRLVKPRLIKDATGKMVDVSYHWPRRPKKIPVPVIARVAK